MRIPRRVAAAVFMALACVGQASPARGQVFELIDSFAGCPPGGCGAGGDISRPTGPLLLGPDGFFYGVSGIDWREGEEGPRSWGAIFRISTSGERVILHHFDETGQGCATTNTLTFGPDGALYGISGRCNAGPHDTKIFRITGGTFEVVQTFPVEGFRPISIIAGPGGAFYGVGTLPGTALAVFYKWDGNAIVRLMLTTGTSDLVRGPDGNIYFASILTFGPGDGVSSFLRLRAGDRIEKLHDFGVEEFPHRQLVLGGDGALYGWAAGMFVGARAYRVTPAGTFTYLADPVGSAPIAAAADGSIFMTGGASIHGQIFRLPRAGALTPVHTFDGADGSGELPALTHGPDGHLYGVRSEGGAHGVGVFYRIRMPAIDVKANRSDGPLAVAPGDPLEISVAFDAAPGTTIETSEVYVAVVTPTLDVFWMTAAGEFTAAPTRVYAGPLAAFGPVPVLTIPDGAALVEGDYYWVTIVDADSNGVPNGTFVDFVKTTKSS